MRTWTIIAVLLVGLLVGLLLFGSSSKPSSHPRSDIAQAKQGQTAPTPSVSEPSAPRPSAVTTPRTAHKLRPHVDRKEIEQQDRELRGRNGERQLREEKHSRPAYQHLPYRTDGARIEITNITSDGRIVLKVIPLALNVNPHIVYREFLRRYHDSGSGYLAEYARFQP